MADNPKFLSALAQANSGVVATDGGGIGDLRRRYNFGPMVSELGIDQTPFFRFLSMAARKPTDDPEFIRRWTKIVGLLATALVLMLGGSGSIPL